MYPAKAQRYIQTSENAFSALAGLNVGGRFMKRIPGISGHNTGASSTYILFELPLTTGVGMNPLISFPGINKTASA